MVSLLPLQLSFEGQMFFLHLICGDLSYIVVPNVDFLAVEKDRKEVSPVRSEPYSFERRLKIDRFIQHIFHHGPY